MFGAPYGSFYNTRPNFGGYTNPYFKSPYHPGWGPAPSRSGYGFDEEEARARARALAEQRARRAQWLPDEIEDPEDDWEYNQLGPRERMYLDAAQRRQMLERQQREQELARKQALEEQRWQQQLEQRQREEDERRRRIVESQRRAQQEKREREEARLRAEAEAARQRQQERARSRSPPDSPTQIPIRTGSPSAPSPSQRRSPSPPQAEQRPPTPQYTERHEEAASRIQTQYRIHRSFKTIQDLENQYRDAKSHFTFPTTLDFQSPSSSDAHISVPVQRSPSDEGDDSSPMDIDVQPEGKLAYTSNNYALHAYMESLLKLLTKLDGVESWGDKEVRGRRRNVVKEIEGEISRLDGCWKAVWREYLASQSEKQEEQQEPSEEEEDQ